MTVSVTRLPEALRVSLTRAVLDYLRANAPTTTANVITHLWAVKGDDFKKALVYGTSYGIVEGICLSLGYKELWTRLTR